LSSVVTYVAQQKGGAMVPFEKLSLSVRIANAFVSYIIYIGKMIWPSNLAVLYPHPGLWPPWQVVGIVVLLAVITMAAIWKMKRFPYLTVGWLWYIGTLIPVIGIVQVGGQARADRYTYIPLIGLFIMAVWGIPELLKKWRHRKEALFASSALTISCLFIVTWTQVGYWQSSIMLFEHALKVTGNNSLAYNNLGVAYSRIGNYNQAIGDLDRAIEINPLYADAYCNRGVAYGRLGNNNQAIRDLDRAIEIKPLSADAYYNRGVAYGKLGNYKQAIGDFDRAIEINPLYADAYCRRGYAYNTLGQHQRAIEDCNEAIRLKPDYVLAYKTRGVAYACLGQYKNARENYDEVIRLNPDDNDTYYNYACSFALQKDAEQACNWLRWAIERGFKNWKHMEADKDFENIRNKECFVDIIKKNIQPAEPLGVKAPQKDLLKMSH
jgi:Flp pilus assembly protein TadD